MINILIADDHKVLLDGLESMLKNEPDLKIVATCQNGEEVLHRLAELKVDIVLLDINMPRMNGIQTTERIIQEHPDIKIIALSMYKQPSYINRMMKLGAHGYVLKDEGKENILTAIKTCALGEQYISKGAKEIQLAHKNQHPTNLGLTSREKEILKELGEGLTSKEISEKLFISFHTVKTHRKHLIQKFDVKNVSGLLAKAKDMGLI